MYRSGCIDSARGGLTVFRRERGVCWPDGRSASREALLAAKAAVIFVGVPPRQRSREGLPPSLDSPVAGGYPPPTDPDQGGLWSDGTAGRVMEVLGWVAPEPSLDPPWEEMQKAGGRKAKMRNQLRVVSSATKSDPLRATKSDPPCVAMS